MTGGEPLDLPFHRWELVFAKGVVDCLDVGLFVLFQLWMSTGDDFFLMVDCDGFFYFHWQGRVLFIICCLSFRL